MQQMAAEEEMAAAAADATEATEAQMTAEAT